MRTFAYDEIETAASVIWQYMTDEPWAAASSIQYHLYRQIARSALTAAERVRADNETKTPTPPPRRGRERYSDWILPCRIAVK